MRHLLALALLTAPLSAQIVEDFEHGDENLYVYANGGIDTLDVVAAATHDGVYGAQFGASGGPAWRARYDLVTSPGNTYDSYVRITGSSTIGRTYVGVAATTTGCASAVFAPNTGQILLLDDTNWGFGTLASASASFVDGTWYVLRLEWAANGDMTVHLLDESASTVLASTATVPTSYTTPGGVALRGFTDNSGAVFHHLDTLGAPGGGTIGTRYCTPGVANSTGSPATMSVLGSAQAAANSLTLQASSLPQNSFGFFLTSRNQGMVNQPGGSQGVLCLGSPIGRYVGPGQIRNSGANGEFSLPLDLTQTPTPGGLVAVQAGDTWNFQAWHRDAVAGTPTSNFTDAVSVVFQ